MSSIRKIAELTGYSLGTIDRAINNRGRISKETQNKILEVAKKIGYTPNIFARNLKLAKVYRFGIIMPNDNEDNGYWKLPTIGINKALDEFNSYKIEVLYFTYSKTNNTSIKKAFTLAIESGVDGLGIVPMLNNSFKKFIETIPSTLPYIFFDAEIQETKSIAFIGQDSYASGYLSAKIMNMCLGGVGSIIVLKYKPSDEHIKQRTQGFADYFKDHNIKINVQVVEEIEPLGSTNVQKYLQKTHGIFVPNAMVSGIAKLIKTLNKKVYIIGYDLLPDNIVLLKEGYIDFLISQRSEYQGYEVIHKLVHHILLNEKIPPIHWMPIDIITQENLPFYNVGIEK